MKTAILITALMLALVPTSQADLTVPVAMAGSGGTIFFAYPDNTVWWASGAPVEIPAANRGQPIRMMHPLLYVVN